MESSRIDRSVWEKQIPFSLVESVYGDAQDSRSLFMTNIGLSAGANFNSNATIDRSRSQEAL